MTLSYSLRGVGCVVTGFGLGPPTLSSLRPGQRPLRAPGLRGCTPTRLWVRIESMTRTSSAGSSSNRSLKWPIGRTPRAHRTVSAVWGALPRPAPDHPARVVRFGAHHWTSAQELGAFSVKKLRLGPTILRTFQALAGLALCRTEARGFAASAYAEPHGSLLTGARAHLPGLRDQPTRGPRAGSTHNELS